MDQSMDTMAEKGRGTDDVMGHLTTGEIVVPLPIAQNQQALAMLTMTGMTLPTEWLCQANKTLDENSGL